MINRPKIIFFDIDDTLYIKSENRILDSTKIALKQLKEQNIIIAIATGRGIGVFPSCVHELIKEIGIEIFVTINGQYNEYRGQALVDFPLTPTQILQATEQLIGGNIAYGYMTKDEIIGFNQNNHMACALTSLNIPYRIADDFDMSTPIYQILAFYENNKTANIRLNHTLKTFRWHLSGVDILDKDGSKARGIRSVLDKLGLNMADAWAFGDGFNDIEMLSSVGFGVAMGNAPNAVKSVADHICPNHTDDGIYQGLKDLGLIQ